MARRAPQRIEACPPVDSGKTLRMTVPAARLRGVSKRFGRVVALDGVRFDLAPGEVHGLLGENGAGKTTLAKAVAGLLSVDAGEMEIGGREVAFGNAAASRSLGVSMVHQHFSLVPRFTGFENVALFDRDGWTRRGTAAPGRRERVEARARELGLEVELDMPCREMSVGERQRVEILKALIGDARVLLLDEPTAVLAPQEVEGLFAALRRLARSGAAIVLVAHKLDEVLAVADRVTVLRNGKRVLARDASATSVAELAQAMVGSALGPGRVSDGPSDVLRSGVASVEASQVVASLKDVTSRSRSRCGLRKVSFEVRRGEIVGVAGVEGNGQRELAAVLAGVAKPDSGRVRRPDVVGWIPQDRTEEGLVGGFSLVENVALAVHDDPACRTGPWLKWRNVEGRTARLLEEMDVLAREGPSKPAAELSGGNQQKLLAGREFLRSGDLLVAESPTRGLDIRASQAVRSRLRRVARPVGPKASEQPPPGVVLISSDLDEILELADRIVVMVRGRLAPVPPHRRSAAAIGEIMLGAVGVVGP